MNKFAIKKKISHNNCTVQQYKFTKFFPETLTKIVPNRRFHFPKYFPVIGVSKCISPNILPPKLPPLIWSLDYHSLNLSNSIDEIQYKLITYNLFQTNTLNEMKEYRYLHKIFDLRFMHWDRYFALTVKTANYPKHSLSFFYSPIVIKMPQQDI